MGKKKIKVYKKRSSSKKNCLIGLAILLIAVLAIYGVYNLALSSSQHSSGDNSDTTDYSSDNAEDHEDSADYVWDESAVVNITLNIDSISVSSTEVAAVSGSTVTITSVGTYRISGSLTDGQIIVSTTNKGTVQLILSNVNINCSTSAPIYVMNSTKTIIIVLDENTQNYLGDSAAYTTVGPNAVIYSMSDLSLYGNGSLNICADYNDGITSKDGLILRSVNLTVNAASDGIRGKDYLIIKDSDINVNAQGNGLLSDNEEDTTKGYITLENNVINVIAKGDAISAKTDVDITGGTFTLATSASTTTSTKGIKGLVSVTINSGTFNINSADDAVHSNGTVIINGGSFTISSGDDGIHADNYVVINGGEFAITKCYEGIESVNITINDGTIHITASDDGINGAGGNDASGTGPFGASTSCNLYINGGYIVIYSGGDGIDVGGTITMTDGYVIVNGPTSNMDGAIDYDGSFVMSGGFIIAVGSSGMAEAPSTTSTQYSMLLNLKATYAAGTIIHVQGSDGTEIVTFKTVKQFQSIVICSPKFAKGSTYDVYLGGSATGTLTDGVYSGGTYTPGTKYTSFTISSMVTRIT